MTEQIEEITKITCPAYHRNKEKKCAGIQECDMKCLHYQRCEALYNAGYRKQSVGEWAVTGTERAWNNAEYPIERTCSVCGMRRNIETQVGWNFCPKCGAKMKGEEDEG